MKKLIFITFMTRLFIVVTAIVYVALGQIRT